MAAILHTQSSADTYSYDRTLTLPSSDHSDHSFCGIVFSISTLKTAPCTSLHITSLAVRGALGPITVYTTKDLVPHTSCFQDSSKWEAVQSVTLTSSWSKYVPIKFDIPVDIPPGECRGFYIHSTIPSDTAIVYDNCRSSSESHPPSDLHVSVHPGLAHLSPTAFSDVGGFGWGGTWRRNRVFVGQVEYGVKTVLWTKKNNELFTPTFRKCATAFYLHLTMTWSGGLPEDCAQYILNMLGWDWFEEAEMRMSKSFVERATESVVRRLSLGRQSTDVSEASGNSERSSSSASSMSSAAAVERRRSVACILM
jgi:hypothetical protein